jgi:hypothetical protein
VHWHLALTDDAEAFAGDWLAGERDADGLQKPIEGLIRRRRRSMWAFSKSNAYWFDARVVDYVGTSYKLSQAGTHFWGKEGGGTLNCVPAPPPEATRLTVETHDGRFTFELRTE